MKVTFPDEVARTPSLYSTDLKQQSGTPEVGFRLREPLLIHQSVFIASPERNANVSFLLQNTVS